jgi:hypothetical protein
MFYFFRRGDEFLRYEVRTTEAQTYEIHIEKPDGTVEVKEFPTARELNVQWEDLQHHLIRGGWWGPYGRDF